MVREHEDQAGSGGLSRRRLLQEAGLGAGALALGTGVATAAAAASDGDLAAFERRLRSRFAANRGVRLHYAIAGKGPLVLFVHGFPGWWWTWRHQMAAVAANHTVAAMDLRGYNLSDQPAGVASYGILDLAADVRAVIAHAGHRRATVVGHDWGGGIAWTLAITAPSVVERLVILNAPHPSALARELYANPRQQRASGYAQNFRRPNAASRLTPESVAALLARPGSKEYPRHLAAMRRTNLQSALNYYAANYPAEPYAAPGGALPRVKAPTLVIYGREDPFVLVDVLGGTWDYVDRPLEIDVIPGAGHFVQNDARDRVNDRLAGWLAGTPVKR
jgi:epoxide hydrolase 4